ncbi:hypothetical protein [Lactobacillus crispatus]|uniref:hypothetical protein n=1 Tax=Lactobacillus crispatus TaxID=47770 RepID=UPI0025516DCC|nr:hypothetical protein [Lactobacillus crispatus]MDK6376775.1 hypothetical protein [Lactobacillus crispatus]
MNEETTNASVTNTDVQPTETEIKDKDEQSTQATSQDKPTVDTPVTPTDKTADAAPKDQNQSDTDKPTSQDKPAETKPTDPATPVKPEQPKKLADVVPTTLVWISGMVGNRQIDCAGPIELPFALTKPEWPYTTVAPNPAYTNQVFDYDSGTWVATDAKSQGQQLTDLTQKVTILQEDSVSHDKYADQSQKIGMQLTQSMAVFAAKLTTMEGKLDTLINTKDGDK